MRQPDYSKADVKFLWRCANMDIEDIRKGMRRPAESIARKMEKEGIPYTQQGKTTYTSGGMPLRAIAPLLHENGRDVNYG